MSGLDGLKGMQISGLMQHVEQTGAQQDGARRKSRSQPPANPITQRGSRETVKKSKEMLQRQKTTRNLGVLRLAKRTATRVFAGLLAIPIVAIAKTVSFTSGIALGGIVALKSTNKIDTLKKGIEQIAKLNIFTDISKCLLKHAFKLEEDSIATHFLDGAIAKSSLSAHMGTSLGLLTLSIPILLLKKGAKILQAGEKSYTDAMMRARDQAAERAQNERLGGNGSAT